MDNTVTASDVRHQFPKIVERVQRGESLVAISHSRPVFRIVPLDEASGPVDWLKRMHAAPSRRTPSLEEINEIVHRIRRGKRSTR